MDNCIRHEPLLAALSEAVARYVQRNPRSQYAASVAARNLPGGNTRSSLWYDPFPLCMVHGEESRLTDADGHIYIDFLGEFTAGIYGHSPPAIKQAITDALHDGINLSSHNTWERRLAELICGRFNSMQLVRFTNSGTEANLMAITAARAFTGRHKILVFEGAYHGSGLTFTPNASPTNLPFDFVVAPYNDVTGCCDLIESHQEDLAAILVEPMLGAGGCLPGAPHFLRWLREVADRCGALLIFDEIQTSRLSAGGRQALLGITPDLTTIGKFFGGGLAFGCFGGRRDIMGLFDPRRPDRLSHAGTFNNNTLTMAAGIAALSQLLTAEALDQVNSRGDRLREAMLDLFRKNNAPFTVTGLGSLMNIHPADTANTDPQWRKLLFFDLLSNDIYVAARGLIALSFSITDRDVSQLLQAVRSFLDQRRNLYT